MQKICFIVETMFSGGAERVVSLLSNQFILENIKVDIICISTNKIESFYKLNGKINLHILCEENNRIPKYLIKIIKLRKLLRVLSPDVIISFLPHVNVYTYLANKQLHIKHIVSERNNPYIDPKNIILRMLKYKAFKSADGCVFQTADAMNYFNNSIKNKSIIIKNPISINENCSIPNNLRKEYIVAVGRLEEQKNYPLLLRSFKQFHNFFPNYILKIFGDGTLKQELIKLTIDLDIGKFVEFKGAVNDLFNQIHDAKMFVMTSKYEGMPNALIEAMALGIPCISTDCPIGGPRELIESYYNGILVSNENETEIVNAMKEIVSNEELSNKLSINARKIKDKLNVKKISSEWINFIFKN